jgi:hypothetical protein
VAGRHAQLPCNKRSNVFMPNSKISNYEISNDRMSNDIMSNGIMLSNIVSKDKMSTRYFGKIVQM